MTLVRLQRMLVHLKTNLLMLIHVQSGNIQMTWVLLNVMFGNVLPVYRLNAKMVFVFLIKNFVQLSIITLSKLINVTL